MAAGEQGELRARIAEYLRAHHTMTIATVVPTGDLPHAAHVFYAVDDRLRLTFLSRTDSLHAQHIGKQAPVAVTVSEEYDDWRLIQGVQLWGTAWPLGGPTRASAVARYLARFPFARELMLDGASIARLRDIGVFRVEPQRAAFTDNTTGLFGQEMLEKL